MVWLHFHAKADMREIARVRQRLRGLGKCLIDEQACRTTDSPSNAGVGWERRVMMEDSMHAALTDQLPKSTSPTPARLCSQPAKQVHVNSGQQGERQESQLLQVQEVGFRV